MANKVIWAPLSYLVFIISCPPPLAVRSIIVVTAKVCAQQTHHTCNIFWPDHARKSAQHTLPPSLDGISKHPWSHGDKFAFSELKSDNFIIVPLTVKVWAISARHCMREKCHVTVIFGSCSDLILGKFPKIKNHEAWPGDTHKNSWGVSFSLQLFAPIMAGLRPFLSVDTNTARSTLSPKKRQNWFSWAP
jgi:hypothetical protein